MPIYSLKGHTIDYNKRVQTKFIQLIMQFLYVDITDYPVTAEGIYQACYDEVVAEATDTGAVSYTHLTLPTICSV